MGIFRIILYNILGTNATRGYYYSNARMLKALEKVRADYEYILRRY